MRRLQRFAAALLPSLLIAAACSHLPPPLPEQNTRLVYPVMGVPLDCADSPVAPLPDADDRDWDAYKAKKDAAGQECRERLRAVKAKVASWPTDAAAITAATP